MKTSLKLIVNEELIRESKLGFELRVCPYATCEHKCNQKGIMNSNDEEIVCQHYPIELMKTNYGGRK